MTGRGDSMNPAAASAMKSFEFNPEFIKCEEIDELASSRPASLLR